jgi:hypothetical protein
MNLYANQGKMSEGTERISMQHVLAPQLLPVCELLVILPGIVR